MSDLVSVLRPNGKTYKPRKPPRAVLVANDDPSPYRDEPWAWVYVLGTHDVNAAWVLARSYHGADYATAQRHWIRLTMRDGERVYDLDEVRGAPAVVFDVTE